MGWGGKRKSENLFFELIGKLGMGVQFGTTEHTENTEVLGIWALVDQLEPQIARINTDFFAWDDACGARQN